MWPEEQTAHLHGYGVMDALLCIGWQNFVTLRREYSFIHNQTAIYWVLLKHTHVKEGWLLKLWCAKTPPSDILESVFCIISQAKVWLQHGLLKGTGRICLCFPGMSSKPAKRIRSVDCLKSACETHNMSLAIMLAKELSWIGKCCNRTSKIIYWWKQLLLKWIISSIRLSFIVTTVL